MKNVEEGGLLLHLSKSAETLARLNRQCSRTWRICRDCIALCEFEGKISYRGKYVKIDKVEKAVGEVVSQIQLDRDNALEWVKENLLKKLYEKSFKQDADYEALKLCHAIQVFVNREILPKLLEGSVSHHGLKCYNTKCWNQDKTKNECKQYYYNIDKCPEWKKEGSACDSEKVAKK